MATDIEGARSPQDAQAAGSTAEGAELGFGLMRLPRRGLGIDIEQTSRMVDAFLAAGLTYFDTAYVYPGSEEAIRKALVERHPRESYRLASKVNGFLTTPTEKLAKRQIETSLERTGAGYLDYYLLHSIMDNNVKRYDRFRLWDYVRDLKAQGLVRNVGFSFHSGPKLLDQLLTEHPDVDFVQLQINYADWEDRRVTSRANYEVARAHGKPIVVMEPVKGGALANPPRKVRALFDSYAREHGQDPAPSYASWAIRFVASLPGIQTVLSGMSNMEQMQDNLSYMAADAFTPLNADEREVIREAQRIMGSSATIPCTACRYCVGECPQHIVIPRIFAAANEQLGNGRTEEAKRLYAAAVDSSDEKNGASACIRCRSCERACPQHLPIVEDLAKCAAMFE